MRKQDKLLDPVFIYSLCYVLLTAPNFMQPVKAFLGYTFESAVSVMLALFGVVLLAVDFFSRRNMLSVPYAAFLFLFLVACAATAVVNRRYGFISNLKCTVWMAIQLILLMSVDPRMSKERRLRSLAVLAEIFVILWFLAAVWSLALYVPGINNTYVTTGDQGQCVTWSGFFEERLYGIFFDPNYGAVGSLFAVGFAAYLLKCRKHCTAAKIFYVVSIAVQIAYIVLSGSRTAEYAAILSLSVCTGFLVSVRIKKGIVWRLSAFVLAAALSCGVLYGAYGLLKKGLSYLPGVYAAITAEPGSDESFLDLLQEEQADLERVDVIYSDDISNNRFTIWKDCLRLFESSPIVGVSPRGYLSYAKDKFGSIYIVERSYATHNDYVSLLTYTGIFGTAAMGIWLVLAVIRVLKYILTGWKERDEVYWTVFIFTAVLMAMAACSMALSQIFFCNSVTTVLFWILMGYTLSFVRPGSGPEHSLKHFSPQKKNRT